jgi:small basic protein (TIGR04137 family)
MSTDRSLKSKSTLERHRNVLTRAERIDHLKDAGTWQEGRGPFGLPKVVHRKAAVGKKDKAEKKPEGEAGAAPAAAPAAEEKPKK